MQEELQRLMQLQCHDTRILELEKKSEEIPSRLQAWQQEFREKEKAHEITKQELDTIEKDLRSKERKLEATNDNLKKYQNQMYSVKTQKEAEALDHEIAKAKTEISRLEDRILNLMEETTILQERIKEEDEEIGRAAEELNKRKEGCQGELEVIGRELHSAKSMRAELVPKINKGLLSLYGKLRQKKENIAIVTIKDGACGGCFMGLPPQVINEVKIAASPITCENCLRILYWENKE